MTKLISELVKKKEGVIVFRNAGAIPSLVTLFKNHDDLRDIIVSIFLNFIEDPESKREMTNPGFISTLETFYVSNIPQNKESTRKLFEELAKNEYESLPPAKRPCIESSSSSSTKK